MTTHTDYRAALAEIADLLSQATDPDDLGIRAGQAIARARALLAAPEAAPVLEDWFFEFEKWLVAEMPAGTVISDPRWWAPRIARACTSRFTAAPEAVGVTDNELLACMIKAADTVPDGQAIGITDWPDEAVAAARAVLSRYGTAHPAPVPVGERLPEPHDYTDEHFAVNWCWWGKRFAGGWEWHQGASGYGLNPGEFSHWLPHWALPLPGDQP